MTHPNDLAYPCNIEYTGEGEHGVPTVNTKTSFGLTKREYIAIKLTAAIVGSINSESEYQRIRQLGKDKGMTASEWIANDALKQTDSLIKALNNSL